MNENECTFEKAFQRLEQILERMNSGNVPLDEALKLYEEADKLIASCGARLNGVEERIEILIKKRNGELATNLQEESLTEAFST